MRNAFFLSLLLAGNVSWAQNAHSPKYPVIPQTHRVLAAPKSTASAAALPYSGVKNNADALAKIEQRHPVVSRRPAIGGAPLSAPLPENRNKPVPKRANVRQPGGAGRMLN